MKMYNILWDFYLKI